MRRSRAQLTWTHLGQNLRTEMVLRSEMLTEMLTEMVLQGCQSPRARKARQNVVEPIAIQRSELLTQFLRSIHGLLDHEDQLGSRSRLVHPGNSARSAGAKLFLRGWSIAHRIEARTAFTRAKNAIRKDSDPSGPTSPKWKVPPP